MIAQIQGADPIHVRDILIVAGFFLSAAAAWVSVAKSSRMQKREVTFAEAYVERRQCDIHHGTVGDRIGGLERRVDTMEARQQQQGLLVLEKIEALRIEIKEDIGRLHGRVDRLTEAMSEKRP